jgi:hypothetical protein
MEEIGLCQRWKMLIQRREEQHYSSGDVSRPCSDWLTY